MKVPKVPSTLVMLGRAVEVDGDKWIWTWDKKDNWIVASDTVGKRLFLFRSPPVKNCDASRGLKKGSRLYKIFNRRKTDKTLKGRVKNLRCKAGTAIHIVYESNKFGPLRHYIHKFDKHPQIWVDDPSKPKIMALCNGTISITTRGIEG